MLCALNKKEIITTVGYIHLNHRFVQACRGTILNSDQLQERLKKVGFDLAIVDGLFFMKCLFLIPHRLQVPYIAYTDAVDPLMARVPWLPSFVPSGLDPVGDRMTFLQRLKNAASVFALHFFTIIPDEPAEVFDKYRQYGYFRNFDDLMRKSLLFLTSKEHLLDYAKPTMPHVVLLGSLNAKKASGDGLPADLRSFVEGAKKGVILVTFGSIASILPRKTAEKFAEAFRQLDAGVRVLWRLNNKDDIQLPNNTIAQRWLPQNDLLAHKNVKLFITHSGNNGQYEALFHGVPMIGFPLFGDQEYNAARLRNKGFGIPMNIYRFTSAELSGNIREVLANPAYKNRIAKASEIYHSAPMSAIETAVYWVEHVCKYGGDHLRSGSYDLPIHEYFMLDIFAAITAVVIGFSFVIIRLGCFCLRKFYQHKPIETRKLKAN